MVWRCREAPWQREPRHSAAPTALEGRGSYPRLRARVSLRRLGYGCLRVGPSVLDFGPDFQRSEGRASVGASSGRLPFHTIAGLRGSRIKMSVSAGRALNCPRQLAADALRKRFRVPQPQRPVRFLHSSTAPHPSVLQSSSSICSLNHASAYTGSSSSLFSCSISICHDLRERS